MSSQKAIHDCPAISPDGQKCVVSYGVPEHELRRVDSSGLGLPKPIHKAADGTRWTA